MRLYCVENVIKSVQEMYSCIVGVTVSKTLAASTVNLRQHRYQCLHLADFDSSCERTQLRHSMERWTLSLTIYIMNSWFRECLANQIKLRRMKKMKKPVNESDTSIIFYLWSNNCPLMQNSIKL